MLSLKECIAAVEGAFQAQGEGKMGAPGILGMHVPGGGFHIKAAVMNHGRGYFAAKLNGNFSGNRERFGLPAIQGVILLSDAENGRPLAVMDSIEITILRTGAATGVAAKYLARKDARTATICGCGNQGRVQLRSLLEVLPITRVFAWDLEESAAQAFAEEMSRTLNIEVTPAGDLGHAVQATDVCVTCTPSRRAFLRQEWVKAGTFIAAVGADNPEKQEVAPELLAGNKVVSDSLEQCATIGDLHHALAAGVMRRDQVHAELGEVVAGRKPGRTSDEEITIFDSTGVALEDVAAAVVVYEKALQQGAGLQVDFAA